MSKGSCVVVREEEGQKKDEKNSVKKDVHKSMFSLPLSSDGGSST